MSEKVTESYPFYQKLNANCKAEEKQGEGPGSCGGANKGKNDSEFVTHHETTLKMKKVDNGVSFEREDSNRSASVTKEGTGTYKVTLDDGRVYEGRSQGSAMTMAKNYASFGYKVGSREIASSPQRRSLSPSASNPFISGEQVRRLMPSGASFSDDGAWVWSKRGGYTGEKPIERVKTKLEDNGWVRSDSTDSHSPDGGVINKREVWTSPDDNWEASFDKSYGTTAADNRFNIKIRMKR